MIRTTLAGEAMPAYGQKQKNENAIVSGKKNVPSERSPGPAANCDAARWAVFGRFATIEGQLLHVRDRPPRCRLQSLRRRQRQDHQNHHADEHHDALQAGRSKRPPESRR